MMTHSPIDSDLALHEIVGEGFYCLGCGYELRGLTVARCPECGKVFDPAQRKTMGNRAGASRFIRTFGRRVGWPMHVIAGLVALTALYSVSVPYFYFLWFVLCFFAALILIGLWILRGLLVLGIGLKFRSALPEGANDWRHWVVLPILFAVTLGLICFGVPMNLRFELSRSAMTQQAQQALANYPAVQRLPNQRIGTYRAENIEIVEGGKGFRFFIPGATILDRSGFAYFPNHTPPPYADDCSYEHFDGDWYVCTWAF